MPDPVVKFACANVLRISGMILGGLLVLSGMILGIALGGF